MTKIDFIPNNETSFNKNLSNIEVKLAFRCLAAIGCLVVTAFSAVICLFTFPVGLYNGSVLFYLCLAMFVSFIFFSTKLIIASLTTWNQRITFITKYKHKRMVDNIESKNNSTSLDT